MSSSQKKAEQDCNSIKKIKYSLKFINEAKFLNQVSKWLAFVKKDSEKVCLKLGFELLGGAEESGMLSYHWVS